MVFQGKGIPQKPSNHTQRKLFIIDLGNISPNESPPLATELRELYFFLWQTPNIHYQCSWPTECKWKVSRKNIQAILSCPPGFQDSGFVNFCLFLTASQEKSQSLQGLMDLQLPIAPCELAGKSDHPLCCNCSMAPMSYKIKS